MPRYFEDYSDDRNKVWCIHCGATLASSGSTRDHTPSKTLLDRPFPENLAVTDICGPCNNGFSRDEEYLAAFVSAVLSGSAIPENQLVPAMRKTLNHAPALRSLVEASREEQFTLWGGSDVKWHPDFIRIHNVVIKNARSHLFFENGEPMLGEPNHVSCNPIESLSNEERANFFDGPSGIAPWCEVGSRWNFRLVEDENFDSQGFLVVQPGVYRFRVEAGGAGLKSVIREYLATSVYW